MSAAKARGVQFGRKRVIDHVMLIEAISLREIGVPVASNAARAGVGTSTLYRYLSNERSEKLIAFARTPSEKFSPCAHECGRGLE